MKELWNSQFLTTSQIYSNYKMSINVFLMHNEGLVLDHTFSYSPLWNCFIILWDALSFILSFY